MPVLASSRPTPPRCRGSRQIDMLHLVTGGPDHGISTAAWIRSMSNTFSCLCAELHFSSVSFITHISQTTASRLQLFPELGALRARVVPSSSEGRDRHTNRIWGFSRIPGIPAGRYSPDNIRKFLLHPVLQRVKGQNHKASAGIQAVKSGVQTLGKLVQLTVHRNAQRLEDPFGCPPSRRAAAGIVA